VGDQEGKRWTRKQLGSVIQASDGELEQGLRERNVVEVDGECFIYGRPSTISHTTT
jgi:sister chromatid cohesion protein DCC1